MWPLAADPVDVSGALISAVWTFLGIVVATLGTIAVQALKGRADRRTTPAPPLPPSAIDNASLIRLAKDIGQLDERASDSDDRDEMQDRRLDRIERHLDKSDPDWRA